MQVATEEKIAAREARLAEKAAAAEAALKAKEEEERLKEENKDQELEDTDNKQSADSHDYNDELPLEDVDNEGGLTKEGDYSLGYDDRAEQSHNDTVDNYETADSSYGYLTEDTSQGVYKPLLDGEYFLIRCILSFQIGRQLSYCKEILNIVVCLDLIDVDNQHDVANVFIRNRFQRSCAANSKR